MTRDSFSNNKNIYFSSDSNHEDNGTTQGHKNGHSSLQGRCTMMNTDNIGDAKHCNSAPAIIALTYHQTRIRQQERNEDILTSEFEVNIKKSWLGCPAAYKSL